MDYSKRARKLVIAEAMVSEIVREPGGPRSTRNVDSKYRSVLPAREDIEETSDEVIRRRSRLEKEGQAIKGAWRMPWHQEPMKDAVSSEMPRGAASRLRSGGVRMGKPTGANLQYPALNT
jgi:hypothetical protein